MKLLSRFRKLRVWRKPGLVLFLAVNVILFCIIGFRFYSQIQQGYTAKFEYNRLEVRALIEQRLIAYGQILRGGVGLFNVSTTVTRDKWKQYVESLDLQSHYPGVQGLGYSVLLEKEQVREHEASLQREGFHGYRIWPVGVRDSYSSIIYLEPFRGRNLRALGYDMYAEPNRKEAMDRSRDQNSLALSGAVKLVQEDDKNIQSGFLMYAPVFKAGAEIRTVEERRKSIVGYVYAPFRVRDFMKGILFDHLSEIKFEVFDTSSIDGELTRIYSEVDFSSDIKLNKKKLRFSSHFNLEFGGRTWLIHVYALPGFVSKMDAWMPFIFVFLGVLINILLLWGFEITLLRKYKIEQLAATLDKSLKEKSERLELAVEGAQDGIWDWDLDTGKLFLSREWKKMIGYDENEISDTFDCWLSLLHPEDVEMAMKSLTAFKKSKDASYSLVHRIRKKDGSYAWMLVKGVARRRPNMSVYRMAGSQKDITANKEHESLLIEAKNQAMLAAEEKAIYLAHMSHEIRTPLNGIIGMAEVLRLSNLNKDQEDLVKTLLDSSTHLKALLNDILINTKREAQVSELRHSEINLLDLLRSVYREFLPLAEKKGLQMSLDITGYERISFVSDAVKIKQLLLNFLQNAIKFTEKGSVILKARLIGSHDDSGQLYIEVVDTGVGVRESAQTTIFEPFAQEPQNKDQEISGAGLGLSICKKIIQVMGGSIGVRSQLGTGSSFYFSVPVFKVVSEKLTSNFSTEKILKTEHSLKILIVEDNEINTKFLARILKSFGHTSTAAKDGKVAVEQIKKNKFDLVLMDCHMPILNGLEATKLIRDWERGGEPIPIFGLTADTYTTTESECLNSGMNLVLHKPLDVERLFHEIEKIFIQDREGKKHKKFDSSALNRLRQMNHLGEKDFAEELIEDFLEVIPINISQLERALKQQDLKVLYSVSHSIKSAAAVVGALKIFEAARSMESSAQKGDLSQFETEFNFFKVEVLDFLN